MRKPGSAFNSIALSTMHLPQKVKSSHEFERALIVIRAAMRKKHLKEEKRFLNHMYYLLGFMVGDLGKEFANGRPWARLVLSLCRKHPENLELGYYVMLCAGELGVPWSRVSDGLPYPREPHGYHQWKSYFSEVIAWLHTACLGLERGELTSYAAVRMDWLLASSREHRLWFLRGIADSDGTVNVKNKSVVITSGPNGKFFQRLFHSINIPANLYTSDGEQYVSVGAVVAMRIRIFNPRLDTHRAVILRQLVSAKVFERHWPDWLSQEVNVMIRKGLTASEIRNRLLSQSGIYVKLQTIHYKMRRM